MLQNEPLRQFGAIGLQPFPVRRVRAEVPARYVRAVPAGLLVVLLWVSLLLVHQTRHSAPPAPIIPVAQDLSSTPYDFAPSPMRQKVLDRRAAGLPLPNPGVVELEVENRQQALDLQHELQLSSTYFHEIQSRDTDISTLNSQLATIASQLGLPKDRLASPAPSAQKAVGALLPSDQTALSSVPALAPAAAGAKVASLGDLVNMVKQYLNLPCPLPAGDPRCAQAVNHAKAELARGHGLDLNRPDAYPTLEVNLTQPFGPTDEELEPLEQVNGQMVHFHEGMDLAAQYDEPVMAAASGTVVFAGVIPSGAQTVEIAHAGGLHSLYLHEDQLLVQQGQKVQKGQIIGLVGATGMATGPHVHFQLQDPSGKPIDPAPYLK